MDENSLDYKQYIAWLELCAYGDMICFRIMLIGIHYKTVAGVNIQCGN